MYSMLKFRLQLTLLNNIHSILQTHHMSHICITPPKTKINATESQSEKFKHLLQCLNHLNSMRTLCHAIGHVFCVGTSSRAWSGLLAAPSVRILRTPRRPSPRAPLVSGRARLSGPERNQIDLVVNSLER